METFMATLGLFLFALIVAGVAAFAHGLATAMAEEEFYKNAADGDEENDEESKETKSREGAEK